VEFRPKNATYFCVGRILKHHPFFAERSRVWQQSHRRAVWGSSGVQLTLIRAILFESWVRRNFCGLEVIRSSRYDAPSPRFHCRLVRDTLWWRLFSKKLRAPQRLKSMGADHDSRVHAFLTQTVTSRRDVVTATVKLAATAGAVPPLYRPKRPRCAAPIRQVWLRLLHTPRWWRSPGPSVSSFMFLAIQASGAKRSMWESVSNRQTRGRWPSLVAAESNSWA
jgi:hypothetical protein